MQKGFEGLTVTFFCTLPIKRFCLRSVCAKNCDGLPVATCLEGKNLRLCDTSREQHMALLKSVIHRQKIHPHPNLFSISGFRRLFPEHAQVSLLLKVLLPGHPTEDACRNNRNLSVISQGWISQPFFLYLFSAALSTEALSSNPHTSHMYAVIWTDTPQL